MEKYYRYNCSQCNGVELSWRADAYWDSSTQSFDCTLDSRDDAFCLDCDEEVTVRDNGEKK